MAEVPTLTVFALETLSVNVNMAQVKSPAAAQTLFEYVTSFESFTCLKHKMLVPFTKVNQKSTSTKTFSYNLI